MIVLLYIENSIRNYYYSKLVVTPESINSFIENYQTCTTSIGYNSDGAMKDYGPSYNKKIIGGLGLNCNSKYCRAASGNAECHDEMDEFPVKLIPCYNIFLEDETLVPFDKCFYKPNIEKILVPASLGVLARFFQFLIVLYFVYYLVYISNLNPSNTNY